jgi:hypothetical protein
VQHPAGATAGGQPHEPTGAGGADGGVRRHDHRRPGVQRGRHYGGGAALTDPDAAQPFHCQPDRVRHHPVPRVHALHPDRSHPQQVGAGRDALQTGSRPAGKGKITILSQFVFWFLIYRIKSAGLPKYQAQKISEVIDVENHLSKKKAKLFCHFFFF